MLLIFKAKPNSRANFPYTHGDSNSSALTHVDEKTHKTRVGQCRKQTENVVFCLSVLKSVGFHAQLYQHMRRNPKQ